MTRINLNVSKHPIPMLFFSSFVWGVCVVLMHIHLSKRSKNVIVDLSKYNTIDENDKYYDDGMWFVSFSIYPKIHLVIHCIYCY